MVTYLLYTAIPSTFLPEEDAGYFFVITKLPNGASLQRTEAVIAKTRKLLQATPGVELIRPRKRRGRAGVEASSAGPAEMADNDARNRAAPQL